MEAALYDPDHGFYSRAPIGERGHFVTSPHVSPVFGHLLARQVVEFWDLLDRPDPFHVVEVGAGDGTLAGQVLSSVASGVTRAIRYVAVERGLDGRERIRRAGVEPRASLDEIPPLGRGCVLANELLDN